MGHSSHSLTLLHLGKVASSPNCKEFFLNNMQKFSSLSIILFTLYKTPITLSQILDENDYLDEDQPSARRFSAVGRFINVTVTTTYSLSMLNKMIQNYGCHCYPGYSKTPGGRGQAVDGQDEICRILARCHQCVMLDHGDTCNPADDGYKYEIDN